MRLKNYLEINNQQTKNKKFWAGGGISCLSKLFGQHDQIPESFCSRKPIDRDFAKALDREIVHRLR